MKSLLPITLLLLAANVSFADELPRVLILGDFVYNAPARAVANELKGKAVVVWRHPGDSTSALENLDEILGKEPWDVVHVNFGFADLHYKDPRTKTVRAMSKQAGGVRVTSPAQYERNLRELVPRLRATGATLVWASTTPLTSAKWAHLYDVGSEVEYNAIAAKVMAEFDVPVDDLHAFVVERAGSGERDPFKFDAKTPLERPIADAVREALGLPAATAPPKK